MASEKVSKKEIAALVTAIAIIALIIGGFSYLVWETQTNWVDQGKITWIGDKIFQSPGFGYQGWITPFSILTNSHGSINFTSSPGMGQLCDNRLISGLGPIKVGDLMGVYVNNCGGFSVLADP